MPTRYETSRGVEWRDKRGWYHRKGDQPAVEYNNGTRVWYRHGEIHRDGDLPAKVSNDGLQEWWREGVLDRKKGPAIIHPDGS